MNAVSSLIASEVTNLWEIIIVESNKSYLDIAKYPSNINVIVPNEVFNFHKFLNIGIESATGNYLALCNNDLIFHENWFSEILKISENHPSILSFSPVANPAEIKSNSGFTLGYKVRTHIMGWCIVVKKEIFDKIGMLDETFDFYYADNDYAQVLIKHNIKHALVKACYVEHLDKKTRTEKYPKVDDVYAQFQHGMLSNIELKKYVRYADVFSNFDQKSLDGFVKFHNKWGNPKMLYRKNKIAEILRKYKLGFMNQFIM